MALWNQKCLPAPPTNTYIARTKNLDLIKLKNALQECIKHFKNEDFMIREATLLSRILYRMKMKFRSSKEFKSLEKLNHSLNNYLNANMVRDLKNIFDLMPSKYQTITYLPMRNMLSYILVRIQGFVKLMERVYDMCHVAAYEINDRISIGHFWKIYWVLFALVSRLYILVKYNTKHLCELYGKLMPHHSKLENLGRDWLPGGYELPSDLREWLGVDWVYEEEFIDLTHDLTMNTSVKILDFFNLVDDDDNDVQICDEYVLVDEEDRKIAKDFRKLKSIEETFTRNRMRGFSINEDDIGEDIAEIIKLNDSKNYDSENIKNDQQIESDFSPTNSIVDVEDVGEEISYTESSNRNQLKIDEPNKYFPNIDLTESTTKETPKHKKREKKSKELVKDPEDISVDVIDDSVYINDPEVIVIPETPVVTRTRDTLENNSLIVLDDTIVNTPAISKKPSDSDLNILDTSTMTRKRKEKDKSKKIKRALNYLFKDEEVENKPLDNSYSLPLQNLSREAEIKIGEPVKVKNNKRKIVENNDFADHKTEEKRPRQSEEEINLLNENIEKCFNNCDKLMLDNSSIKMDIKSKEENLKQLNGNRTMGESDNVPHENITFKNQNDDNSSTAQNVLQKTEIQTKEEKIKPKKKRNKEKSTSKGNITKSEEQDKKSTSKKKSKKKKKQKLKFELERIVQEDPDQIDLGEYSDFNSELKDIHKFMRRYPVKLERNRLKLDGREARKEILEPNAAKERKPKEPKAAKEKETKEKERRLKWPKCEKESTNVIRLNLIKEIPKKGQINQKRENTGVSASKEKGLAKMKLIPRLESPLRARLNVESLMKLSSNGGTTEHNIQSKPLKTLEREPGKKQTNQKFEEDVCSMFPDKLGNKEFKKESVKNKNLNIKKAINSDFQESPFRRKSGESPFVFIRMPREPDRDRRSVQRPRIRRMPYEYPESKFFRNDEELRRAARHRAQDREHRKRLNVKNHKRRT